MNKSRVWMINSCKLAFYVFAFITLFGSRRS